MPPSFLGLSAKRPSRVTDTSFLEIVPVGACHVDIVCLHQFRVIPEKLLVCLHLLLQASSLVKRFEFKVIDSRISLRQADVDLGAELHFFPSFPRTTGRMKG